MFYDAPTFHLGAGLLTESGGRSTLPGADPVSLAGGWLQLDDAPVLSVAGGASALRGVKTLSLAGGSTALVSPATLSDMGGMLPLRVAEVWSLAGGWTAFPASMVLSLAGGGFVEPTPESLSESGGILESAKFSHTILALMSTIGLIDPDSNPAASTLALLSGGGGHLAYWPEHVPLALLPYRCFDWGPWADRWACGPSEFVCEPGAPVSVNEHDFEDLETGIAGAAHLQWCVEGAGTSWVQGLAYYLAFEGYGAYDDGEVDTMSEAAVSPSGTAVEQYILGLPA